MKRLLLILCCLAIGLGAWTILVRRGGKGAPEGAEDPRPVVLFHIVDAAGAGVAGASVADGHADEAGRFDFLIPEGKEATVRVSSSGYCPAEVSVGPLEAGRKLDRWVRLERGRSLEARVCVAGSSQPAAGAHVKLDLHSGPVDSESPRFATADERGVVRFDGVPDFFFDLAVVPPYYKSGRYELELVPDRAPDPILIPARRSTHVVVEIVDPAGDPARGARVVSSERDGIWSRPTVAENGVFETDVVEGRSCRIDAIDSSWAAGSTQLTSDGRREWTARLVLTPAQGTPDAWVLRVRVVDEETGRGIPGAHLRLSSCLGGADSEALGMHGLETGAEGRLVLTLPFRGANVAASCEGYYGSGVTLFPGDPSLLEEVVLRLSPKDPARTITCHAAHALWIDGRWQENVPGDTIELGGFDSDDKTRDIRYRPKADIARVCVLRAVAIGSHDVELPLYPMGDLLVRCTDPKGHAVPGANVAISGDGFSGNVTKMDPRGELLVRDLPAGEAEVWAYSWRRGEVGPLKCVIPEGGRAEIDARFGPRLALLGTHLTLVDGQPGVGFEVIVFDSAGEPVDVVPERFCEPGPPSLATLSDGRLYIPLPAQDVSVGFRGDWDGPLIGPEKAVVPTEGIVDLDLKLGWSVFVSGLDPGDAPTSFRRGDIIVTWDGREVHDIDDCTPREGPLRVTVRRGDETIDLNLPAGPHTAILDRQYFVVR